MPDDEKKTDVDESDFVEWCEKNCKPVVDQYNAGAITLDELVCAIISQVTNREPYTGGY